MPKKYNSSDIVTTIMSFFQYIGLPVVVILSLFHYFNRNRMKNLQGKVVFITGASSGVGEALAHVFYSQGCKLILAARREKELLRVQSDLISRKETLITYKPIVLCLDLSDIASLDQVVQKACTLCGDIDILINNGGISSRGNILETKIDVHTKLMNVNHFGPMVLTKAVLPSMIERKTGHIIFVNSVQGVIAIPDRSAYAASKHANRAFADTLRAEVSKHNINVSVIYPGYIQTALSLNALNVTGDLHGVMDPTTAAGYKPEFVANKILEMVATKAHELVLAPVAPRIAIMLRYLAPSIYCWIMAKRASQ